MNRTIVKLGHNNEFGTIMGKDPKSFEVTQVYRIQNMNAWGNFCACREELRKKLENEKVFRNYLSAFPLLSECLDEKSNEYFLFHGTDFLISMVITEGGFDQRFARESGMFGPGIYFAENSSKANQYVSCPKCHGGSIPKKDKLACTCDPLDLEYCIILSRVCLGNSYVSKKYIHWQECKSERLNRSNRNYTPYPKTGCYLCETLKEDHLSIHDSVLVESTLQEGELRAREFVVYDFKQTYPELLIYYKRKFED